jgi:hypothetical protein
LKGGHVFALPYASCLSTFRAPGWGTPAILPPCRWRNTTSWKLVPFSHRSASKIFITRPDCIPSPVGWHEARKKARPRHGTTRNYFRPGRPGTMHRAGFGPKPRPMGGHEPGPFNKARKGPLPGTNRPVIINPASQPILPFATARCQPNAHERTKTRPAVQVQLPQTQTPSRQVQSPQKP